MSLTTGKAAWEEMADAPDSTFDGIPIPYENEEYFSNGWLDFVYGKDGLTIMSKTIEQHCSALPYETSTLEKYLREDECCHKIYDLMSGEAFLENVKMHCITDEDGSLANVFVDGLQSNLGLVTEGFHQGEFLVTAEVFEELCKNYKIEVNWANK